MTKNDNNSTAEKKAFMPLISAQNAEKPKVSCKANFPYLCTLKKF